MSKTLIVNTFAGPGAGKSTSSWALASALKLQGLNTEYVPEYAKELVYDQNYGLLDGSLDHQKFIFTEQKHRLDRLIGQVDIIITDAPLLLNSIYLAQENTAHSWFVGEQFNSYNNFNLFIDRTDTAFEQRGRIQDLDQSKEKDAQIKNLLEDQHIPFLSCTKFNVSEMVPQIAHAFNQLENDHQLNMEGNNMEKSTDPRYFILNDRIPELHTYKMAPMYDEYPDYVTYESTLYVPRPSKDDFLILEEDELSIASLKLDSFGEFIDFSEVLLEHKFKSTLDFLNAQLEIGTIRESSEEEYNEQYHFATRPFFAKIECYDEQDELVDTLLCKSRSDCRWTIEDAMNYYDRIDTKEISEAEYMALKEQQEASQTDEKEEPIVTPIAENEHVQELLTIMDDNKIPDRQELIAMLNHLSTLERQLDAALKEVAALRIEQANVQKQNQPTHDLMQNSVSVMQSGLQSLKNRLGDLKQQFIEGCKNAVADFKQRGISALDNVVRLFQIRPALEAINNQLDKSIHFAETTVSKIEAVSAEYHEAGRHIQNMARAATGKETVSEAKSMGKLAQALEAPFKAERSLLASMRKSADAALSQLAVLEQLAGRDMIAEPNQVHETIQINNDLIYYNDKMVGYLDVMRVTAVIEPEFDNGELSSYLSNVKGLDIEWIPGTIDYLTEKESPFFGKIEFAQGDGKSEIILYDDKERYEAAASAQNEFGVELTAIEITEAEYLELRQELAVSEQSQQIVQEDTLEWGGE